MSRFDTVEIKAFVPARDLALSQRFYEDLGFTAIPEGPDMVFMHAGHCSFLLQRFYVKEHAENFMMHLMVRDVEAWYQRVLDRRIAETYGVRVLPPEDRPWGIRDFCIDDPTSVLWRIGEDITTR